MVYLSKEQIKQIEKENDLVGVEYKYNIEAFKTADKNYPKFMYETLMKLNDLGKKMDPEFTISKLCADLEITYERYKFYMKYCRISDETKDLVESGKIKQDVVMNIIHRFPRRDWKELIKKQLKYNLTRNDIVKLRKNDKHKDKKNWDKMFDERSATRKIQAKSVNKRSVRIWCDKLIKELKDLECFNKTAKEQIYEKIKTTKDKLSEWMDVHRSWAPKRKED